MSSSPVEPADLFDLKLLPAWVKEPAEPRSYEHYTGEEGEGRRDGRRPPRDKRDHKFKRSAFRTPINREQELNVHLKAGKPMRASRKRQGATPKVFASGAARHGGARPGRRRAGRAGEWITEKTAIRETSVLRSRECRWRSRPVFCHIHAYSKTWQRRSSRARLRIPFLPWRVCSLKSRNVTKFV